MLVAAEASETTIILRALSQFKSSGAAFQAHIGEYIESLGYVHCLADPDL